MAVEAQRRWTAEEYLALERQAELKSEFHAGEIFAMAGASRRHNLINGNLFAALHPQVVGRGCEIYASDMRVLIPDTELFTYPDLTIVCDEPQFRDEELDTLLNPTLVAEVLSSSTEDYDRGRKFAHYRTLPSLRGYLLVAQDRVHAELFTRQPDDRWLLSETDEISVTLELSVIEVTLALGDVYARVPGL